MSTRPLPNGTGHARARRAILAAAAAIGLLGCGGGSQSPAVPAPDASASAQGPATTPVTALSDAERSGLLWMREEEKLAHDIYTLALKHWGEAVFANIADSEASHKAAMLRLLQRYGLPDPAQDRPAGSFADPALQAMYDALAARTRSGALEALQVGAEIEEIDLIDILERRAQTDREPIQRTYDNLLAGSENHLRAFVRALAARGVIYAPRHLPQAQFDAVIAGG